MEEQHKLELLDHRPQERIRNNRKVFQKRMLKLNEHKNDSNNKLMPLDK